MEVNGITVRLQEDCSSSALSHQYLDLVVVVLHVVDADGHVDYHVQIIIISSCANNNNNFTINLL